MTKIRDLYTGKPDAKDEINFDGYTEFIQTYVVSDTMNIDALLKGSNCFITGYKGTGKTALLFYLDNLVHQSEPYGCASFVFFKDEFSDSKKNELEGMSKRILSSVSIAPDSLVSNTDFEYIWRWIFFKRIVSDNEEYNQRLFLDNQEWQDFCKILNTIKAPEDKRKNIITPKIKLAIPYKDPNTLATITPECEVDFQKTKDDSNYAKFMHQIDDAEKAFLKLTKTDVAYYIFVDELEAYYGDIDIFRRDLYFIRDLIFTIKRFNNLFHSLKMPKMKIICAVRTEILNSISRHIVTKEMNKIISGFEIPLIWDYSNTNSYAHPIIQILLKRIRICENDYSTIEKDLYQRWFPEVIHDIEPANYILNNSWHKPRDIVRLLTAARNCIKNDETKFSQAVFNALYKKYSAESLIEIKEEMRALYSPEQIETIISFFVGFKTIFSLNQIKERVEKIFPNTIWGQSFNQIIQDLYRLGFIGNYLPASKTYRWQHKSDDGVILADEWRLIVHFALHGALSIGRKQDIGLSRKEPLQKGDMVNFVVDKVIRSFVLGEFNHFGTIHSGSIHIKQLNQGYVQNIFKVVAVGDELRAMVLGYNEERDLWNLTLDFQPPLND